MDAEVRRLDAHFRGVLERLRGVEPSRLPAAPRRERRRHLDELERYRRRGRFPINRRSLRPTPIFVDDSGTRCAMGHLIERAGGRELVERVAEARNFDLVRDLADVPELRLWLAENGLTLREAALIQPSYCYVAADCFCSSSVETLLEGDVVDGPSLLVSAVHGKDVGVSAGETVQLDYLGAAVLGDRVFAELINSESLFVQLVVDESGMVTAYGCSPVGRAPGPLPKDVFTAALFAEDHAECHAVLAAHDPQWVAEDGDCGSSSTTTSTTTSTTSSSSSTGGAMAGPETIRWWSPRAAVRSGGRPAIRRSPSSSLLRC
jgi:hypothetical protein